MRLFTTLLVSMLPCTVFCQTRPEVETAYNALSIQERVSQIILLDVTGQNINPDDPDLVAGGIFMEPSGISEHLAKIAAIEKLQLPTPIFFAKLSLNPGLISVGQFGSPAVFQLVNEPHLYYETGISLGKQFKLMGISALIPDRGFTETFPSTGSLHWKYSEISQGIKDSGLIPINEIRILELKNLEINALKNAHGPVMVRVKKGELTSFHEKIREALAGDQISLDEVESVSRRIFELKFAYSTKITDPKKNETALNKLSFDFLQSEIARAAIRITKNGGVLIPITDLADKKIACVHIHNQGSDTFKKYIEKYAAVTHFEGRFDMNAEAASNLWNQLVNFDLILVALYDPGAGFQKDVQAYKTFQGWLNNSGKCIWASMLPREQFLRIQQPSLNPNLISAPEDNEIFRSLLPQYIFGAVMPEGRIPNLDGFKAGATDPDHCRGRFAYTFPEAVRMKPEVLNKIDSIVSYAINEHAIPGCQVLVAKDNMVIFQRSYGFHTYDSITPVQDDDLYDLASVTKVSGALPGLMKLYEEGRFDLDATIGDYVKYFRRGNKKELTFREILAHQSGMVPWIPYWQSTIKKNGKFRNRTLRSTWSEKYPYEVSTGMYLFRNYKKTIYKQIRKSEMGEKKYLYSGLTFFIFPEIIEKITGQKYEDYLRTEFYDPLGATTLTYNPLNHFPADRIVQTEYDSLFRKTQIQGKVHDEGAAMMEGISSNAGLFSSANDLAKLWQMYCNYGEYGGKSFLKEETVKEFARCQYPENNNRRGLGFDRPLPEPHENGNSAKSVSQRSFGHTGFTGTFAWADPEYKLVYIFLSNRVYPTRENTKLYDMNVRTNIQEIVYQAMK